MKTLSICQPYPELILLGEKPVENRTWYTHHRGPLVIHAGKSRDWLHTSLRKFETLHFGALVGLVDLVDCVLLNKLHEKYPRLLGHEHTSGPWCWIVEYPRRFAEPIAWTGKQKLFDVPDDVIARAKKIPLEPPF